MGNSGVARFGALMDKLSVVIFIAVVILIIYFIARYISYANRSARISLRARRDHLAQENPSMVDMPAGLGRAVIESLPMFVYEAQQMKKVLECAVCLSEFRENEKGRLLPNCNHRFHIECIDMWLFSHSTCPICRAKIEASSPGKEAELGVGEELRAVFGCGHGSKGQTSSTNSPDMDEVKPLPETAIDISNVRF